MVQKGFPTGSGGTPASILFCLYTVKFSTATLEMQ